MTERIAFLGIGLMGAPMATNLAARPASRSPPGTARRAKAEALDRAGRQSRGQRGRSGAATPTSSSPCWTNGPAVEEVLFGAGNAAAAMRAGALVIDMSSIPPATARVHAERLAKLGIAHLDAPVSGGTGGARDGKLVIMAGGKAGRFRARRAGVRGAGQADAGRSGSGAASSPNCATRRSSASPSARWRRRCCWRRRAAPIRRRCARR